MMGVKTVLMVYHNYNLVKKFANELYKNNYRLEMYTDPNQVLLLTIFQIILICYFSKSVCQRLVGLTIFYYKQN